VGQVVGKSPAADSGRIEIDAEAALEFGGDETVRRGRTGTQQLAHERFDVWMPLRGVIAAGSSRSPVGFAALGAGAEVIGVELVETGASEFETASRLGSVKLPTTEGGEDLADQRNAEAMRQLAIVFFIASRLAESGGRCPPPPLGFYSLGLSPAGAGPAGPKAPPDLPYVRLVPALGLHPCRALSSEPASAG